MSAAHAPAEPDRDPGLQPERTRLAWRRTTLAATVAALLALRTTVHGGPPAGRILLGAACCGLWLGFLLVAHHRIRVLAASAGPAPLAPRRATAAALLTVALAVCGAALVL